MAERLPFSCSGTIAELIQSSGALPLVRVKLHMLRRKVLTAEAGEVEEVERWDAEFGSHDDRFGCLSARAEIDEKLQSTEWSGQFVSERGRSGDRPCGNWVGAMKV